MFLLNFLVIINLLLIDKQSLAQTINIDGILTSTGSELDFSYEKFASWAGQTNLSEPYLILYPKYSRHVTSIVNWAYQEKKHVRVQGHRHASSPLVVTERDDPTSTVLIDFTRYMKKLRIGSLMVTNESSVSNVDTIIAEPGASMDDFFTFSEQNGLSIVMSPTIGDATIAGLLAVGAHGGAIPSRNEKLAGPGYSFGSLSNLITKFDAVVWEKSSNQYVIKTFTRSDPDSSAFLVHLGRTIIIEITFLVGKNYHLRCVSRVDVPAKELFAHPRNSSGLRTMSSFLEEYGRVDAIWYPFVESPWVKIWEVLKTKPPGSRLVRQPYNYQFETNQVNPQTPGPVFGQQFFDSLIKGLTETRDWDIFGYSKNTILYYNKTTTPRVNSGFAVLTNRANIQYVLHDIVDFYTNLLNEYHSQGQYPIDQYIKFRISGLDDPREIPIPLAVTPDISPTSPISSRPDFNVAVWMNCLTTTKKAKSDEFMNRFEKFAYERFDGRDGLARPEWSKNWGHSASAPFTNPAFLQEIIPDVFGSEKWNHAVNTLNKYDPHQIISNRFLRELMVPFRGRHLIKPKFGWGRG